MKYQRCFGIWRDYYAVFIDDETGEEVDIEKRRGTWQDASTSGHKEDSEAEFEEEELPAKGSISCIGYSEYYSATLARAMGSSRGMGPRIFCKGMTIIPINETQSSESQKRIDRITDQNFKNKHRTPESTTSSSHNWSGSIEFGIPTNDQIHQFSVNMSKLLPVIMSEGTKASKTFVRNANKVLKKMTQNARDTGLFVYNFVGARKPPPSS